MDILKLLVVFGRYIRLVDGFCGTLLRLYMALLWIFGALLPVVWVHTALLRLYITLLQLCKALFWVHSALESTC